MKLLLQLALFCLLIIISFFFYKNYFSEEKINVKSEPDIKQEIIKSDKNQNNIIKNLKYQVSLTDRSEYTIQAQLGEVIFENNIEVVLMKGVTAIFTDKNNKKLFINSKNAKFYSNNYNTFFKDDIKIKYESNNIISNNLDFNFTENNILIYNNVIYSGIDRKIETDNIKINIVTKNIEIFMNELDNNVKISSF
tara:strand:- start:50 stop:631 length:582 start_codon:yes stop_codon:yes gene_type:complete